MPTTYIRGCGGQLSDLVAFPVHMAYLPLIKGMYEPLRALGLVERLPRVVDPTKYPLAWR